ncbi:hypothetical protein ACLOJK_004280, partial [Asimina triloba]
EQATEPGKGGEGVGPIVVEASEEMERFLEKELVGLFSHHRWNVSTTPFPEMRLL